MSKSVTSLVLIRDSVPRIYEEIWATLYRELVWGPAAFEAWAGQRAEAEYEPAELASLAIVDFDQRSIRWYESEGLQNPRVKSVYDVLLRAAWPGYSIQFLTRLQAYREINELWPETANDITDDQDGSDESEEMGDEYDENALSEDVQDPLSWRLDTAEDAMLYHDDDVDADDDEDESVEDSQCWVTILSDTGECNHRALTELTKDLITADPLSVPRLAGQRTAAIASELYVNEGLFIDLPQKRLSLWGNQETRTLLDRFRGSWVGWDVVWLENGYRDHCELAGVPGKLVDDESALAAIVPQILQTENVVQSFMGLVGGELKRNAIKATGCLVVVLSLPIVLAGIFMGKMKEAGYAILTLLVIVIVLFKLAEWRLAAKFNRSQLGKMVHGADESRPVVAGPLEEKERRNKLNILLAESGLPTLAAIESRVQKGS